MPRRIPTSRGPQLDLAGALCVAFVNTAGARPDNGQQGVATYDELLGWSQRTGIVSALEAERLSRRAAGAAADAAAALQRAIELRDSLVRLFLLTARGRPLTTGDLRDLNGALTATLPALRLVPGEHGVTWGWAGDADALDRMLWPVLHSAADVLIATEGRMPSAGSSIGPARGSTYLSTSMKTSWAISALEQPPRASNWVRWSTIY